MRGKNGELSPTLVLGCVFGVYCPRDSKRIGKEMCREFGVNSYRLAHLYVRVATTGGRLVRTVRGAHGAKPRNQWEKKKHRCVVYYN